MLIKKVMKEHPDCRSRAHQGCCEHDQQHKALIAVVTGRTGEWRTDQKPDAAGRGQEGW